MPVDGLPDAGVQQPKSRGLPMAPWRANAKSLFGGEGLSMGEPEIGPCGPNTAVEFRLQIGLGEILR